MFWSGMSWGTESLFRSVGLFFRLAVTQSCLFCGFWGEKKKRKKEFKPVFQVPTSHKIHQCACICCLDCGGEDTTTGIKLPSTPQTSVLGYRPVMSKPISCAKHRSHAELQYIFSLGALRVFSPKDTCRWFWLGHPGLASPFLAIWGSWCGVTGCGVTPHSFIAFWRWGGWRDSSRSIGRSFLTPFSEWEHIWTSSQMWEQLLFFCLDWTTRHNFQLPCCMWGGAEGNREAVWTRLTIWCIEAQRSCRHFSQAQHSPKKEVMLSRSRALNCWNREECFQRNSQYFAISSHPFPA